MLIIALIVLTFSVTCRVFESHFAEITIDWFAFLAGIYLVVEGLYKLRKYSKERIFPDQLMRIFRIFQINTYR